MAYLVGSPSYGAPGDVHASALMALGTRRRDADGNEYIYLTGVASTVIGSWVTFDELHVTALAVASAKGRVAVATAAVDANTKFGWYQVYGKAVGKALALFADNADIYVTATPGSVDDAIVAGDQITGTVGRSAIDGAGTGLIYAEINYPFIT